MTSRTCPDWPRLMEIAPDLQFMHYSVAAVQLPTEALMKLDGVSFDELSICCDLEHHVFNAEHTDGRIAAALRETHWFDLREWVKTGPGGAAA
jgi:hypothetical protein